MAENPSARWRRYLTTGESQQIDALDNEILIRQADLRAFMQARRQIQNRSNSRAVRGLERRT